MTVAERVVHIDRECRKGHNKKRPRWLDPGRKTHRGYQPERQDDMSFHDTEPLGKRAGRPSPARVV